MMNKRTMVYLVFLVFITVNCNAQSSSQLVGKWFFEELAGSDFVVLEFSRTEMSFYALEDDDYETYPYKSDGRTIIIDGDEEWRYTIRNGNSLVITDSDNYEYIGMKLQANVTSLSGKYELVNDIGFIETLEFLNRTTVRGTMDAFGTTGRFTAEYRISGSNVIMSNSTGGHGTMTLEIIGDSILKGNTFGGLGEDSIFIKR